MTPRHLKIATKESAKLLPLAALPFLLYWGVKVAQRRSEVSIEELNHQVQQSLPEIGTYASVVIKPKNWSWSEGYNAKASWSVHAMEHDVFIAARDVRVQRRAGNVTALGTPAKIVLTLQLQGDTADPIGQIQIDWLQPRSRIQSTSVMNDATAKAFNIRFAAYELTPQSRRQILDRIEKQYGKQLRALHIPPPQ